MVSLPERSRILSTIFFLFLGEIAAEIVKSGAFKSILDSLSDPNEDVKSTCLAAITNFSANGK